MKVVFEGKNIILPDVFIVGAAKAGTTSLANFLMQHPNVFIPVKEPHFFSFYGKRDAELPVLIKKNIYNSIDKYLTLYKNAPQNSIIIDSSVSYLTLYKESIQNLKKLYGEQIQDVKFIIMLRNPVDRAYSHHQMFVRNGVEDLSFEHAIHAENIQQKIHLNPGFNYLENSLYYDRVKAYMDNFKSVKIYLTADLKSPKILLHDLLTFCNLNTSVNIDTETRFNQGGTPKNKALYSFLNKRNFLKNILKKNLSKKVQYYLLKYRSKIIDISTKESPINKELKNKLILDYYMQDIEKTEKLIQKDLSAWKIIQ